MFPAGQWCKDLERRTSLACFRDRMKAPCMCMCVCQVHAKLLQLWWTLCDPMDCSPPGSSVHGILPARILEWVAIYGFALNMWMSNTSFQIWQEPHQNLNYGTSTLLIAFLLIQWVLITLPVAGSKLAVDTKRCIWKCVPWIAHNRWWRERCEHTDKAAFQVSYGPVRGESQGPTETQEAGLLVQEIVGGFYIRGDLWIEPVKVNRI